MLPRINKWHALSLIIASSSKRSQKPLACVSSSAIPFSQAKPCTSMSKVCTRSSSCPNGVWAQKPKHNLLICTAINPICGENYGLSAMSWEVRLPRLARLQTISSSLPAEKALRQALSAAIAVPCLSVIDAHTRWYCTKHRTISVSISVIVVVTEKKPTSDARHAPVGVCLPSASVRKLSRKRLPLLQKD